MQALTASQAPLQHSVSGGGELVSTYIANVAPINSSNALFRAWGSGISTALAAVGLVKTADTGQIDWATVVAAAPANTQQGYEIWRFNDSLQATAPIFLRIAYGSGSATAMPSLWFTIGKGSDGAGTITGVLQAATQVSAAASSATVLPCYVSSGDGSMLAFGGGVAPTGGCTLWWFTIERSRSVSGAATATGLSFLKSTYCSAYNYALATTWNLGIYAPITIPGNLGDAAGGISAGGNLMLFPAVVADGQGNFWQPRSLLGGHRSDTGISSVVNVSGWGPYMALGASGQGADSGGALYSAACIAWW